MINNNKIQERKILTDKGKHSVKDQPTVSLVQKLKGKNRKIMCNYNSK